MKGAATSCVLFFIPYGAFTAMMKEDGSLLSDQQTFAVSVATALVIVVNVQVRARNNIMHIMQIFWKKGLVLCHWGVHCFQCGLENHYWTLITLLFLWGSITMYFALLFAMQSDGIFGISQSHFPFVGKFGCVIHVKIKNTDVWR